MMFFKGRTNDRRQIVEFNVIIQIFTKKKKLFLNIPCTCFNNALVLLRGVPMGFQLGIGWVGGGGA